MPTELLYPSTVVNLRLRFDETFRIGAIPEPGPQGGDPDAVSVVPPQSTGARRRYPRLQLASRDAVGKVFRETSRNSYNTNTRPLISQTGSNNLSVIANRIPKSANVECPNYRIAGKFSLEFDWRELPIDPRLVRSAAVEIYMGSVRADDFAKGMAGVYLDGRRASVLSTTDPILGVNDQFMVLYGLVDTWFVQHNDQSSIVKIDGRDLRGVFLDSPIDPEVMNRLDLTKSVVDVVAAIVQKHPAHADIKVLHQDKDWPGGKPPTLLAVGDLTRVRRGASGDEAGGGTTEDKLSMWDLITRYCDLAGAVPYVRGRNIIIRPAQSLHDPSKPRFDSTIKVFDPQPRYDDDGNPFFERKMTFGREIKELTFERKLAGTKVPVVEVSSFDTSSKERGAKKLLVVQYPPKDKQLARVSGVYPSGEVSQTDILRIAKPGIRDKNVLFNIAKQLYEEIGRGELGGSCTTTTLASFKGDNDDPDLLRLRPGDQITFAVDIRELTSKVPNVSVLTDSARLPFDEAVKRVQEALSGKAGGGDENLARVIVATSRSQIIDLIGTFRVANVVFSWSLGSGIQVSFDFQNYFVTRHQVTNQLGENPPVPSSTTLRTNKSKRPKVIIPAQPVLKTRTPIRAGGGGARASGRTLIRAGGGGT